MNIFTTLSQYVEYEPYSTTTRVDSEASVAVALITFFVFLFMFAIIYVINAIFLGKIFKKAGLASWPAWVPLYNNWKLLELGGQQGFWAVLSLIPIVNIVAAIFVFIAMYHIGLKLGKSGAFVVLGIFLPFIWLVWLALDSSQWNESAPGAAPSLATGPRPEGQATPPTPPAPTAAV